MYYRMKPRVHNEVRKLIQDKFKVRNAHTENDNTNQAYISVQYETDVTPTSYTRHYIIASGERPGYPDGYTHKTVRHMKRVSTTSVKDLGMSFWDAERSEVTEQNDTDKAIAELVRNYTSLYE